MFKKLGILTTTLLVVPATMALADQAKSYNCDYSPSCEVAPGVYGAMGSPVTSKFNLSIGGYVKLDYVHNSNQSGPRATLPGGPTLGGSNDESYVTAKQSRFWLKVAGPTLLGGKTSALLESDFYGGTAAPSVGNETPVLRLRHAYGAMDWTNTQILFGQFWDVFGPGSADTIDFSQGGNSGTPNSPRVSQVRVTQKFDLGAGNGLKVVVAAQNPTQAQVAAPAGQYGSQVNYAGQLAFTSKILGVSPGMMGLFMAPLQVVLFGETSTVKQGATDHDVYGYGVYTFVPLLKSRDGKNRAMTATFEGQLYQSAGLSSQLANASELNAKGNAAKGFGYWGQLKFYPTQDLGLTAGYEGRNASDYASFAGANFEKYNKLAYVNATFDLNAAIRVATEYEHNEVKHGNVAVNYGQNNVFRLAAYYFF